MSTLEATVSILGALPETDLLAIYDLAKRCYAKQDQNMAPKAMTEEQMLERSDVARKHASEGKVMDADVAIGRLRRRYGL